MIFSGISFLYPNAQELFEIGGNRRNEVFNGEYWRLVSSIFIHGGVMHLAMNLIGLVVGASLLEQVLGHFKLLVSYIICGIIASLCSIYWHENTVSVGASGAIFGLFGLIFAFTVFKIYDKHTRKTTWLLLGAYAGLSLVFGFLVNGIDNSAHVGGLLCGFILGTTYSIFKKEFTR